MYVVLTSQALGT